MPHLLFSSLPSFPAKHTQHIREENVKEQFGGIYIDEATNQLRIEAPPNAATFVDGVDVVAELNNLKSITATSQVSVYTFMCCIQKRALIVCLPTQLLQGTCEAYRSRFALHDVHPYSTFRALKLI